MQGQEAGEFEANPETGSWTGPDPQCMLHYATPVIADRYVSSDGHTEQEHQQFTYSTTWSGDWQAGWSAKTTTVTTTDQVAGKSFLTVYSYAPYALGPPPYSDVQVTTAMPMESEAQYYNIGGGLLRTASETWTGFPLVPTEQRTMLDNGKENEAELRRARPDDVDRGWGSV